METLERQKHGCPSNELLLGYALTPASQPSVAAHLDTCDACVGELVHLQRRLAIASEVEVRVPASLAAQAVPPVRVAAAQPSLGERLAEWFRGVADGFRMPMLVPLGAAALALFVFSANRTPTVNAPALTELTRDVQVEQAARLTRDGILRSAPKADATSLRGLSRGDSVVLSDRRGDWYQVALSDGTNGWIEAAAFE